MPAEGFTLRFGEGEQNVSMDVLKEALGNALEMLRNVGQDFTPTGAVIHWEVVAASLRSPLSMTFAPRVQGNGVLAVVGRQTATACVHGLRQLEKRPSLPDHFNEDALLAAQKLVKGAKVTLAVDRNKGFMPTSAAVDHISQIIEKARIYLDYGALEGRLEEISVHDSPSFAIWESFTNHKIDCAIDSDRLEEAKGLLGKRVAVSGRIRYRNHKPTSIQVESVRRLRDESELPQLENMPPIDITSGLSSEEYIRRMRDAQ
jgi:hypothetical protein